MIISAMLDLQSRFERLNLVCYRFHRSPLSYVDLEIYY